MGGVITPPPNFLLANQQNWKKLAVVVDIPGIDYLCSTQIGRSVRYGDPVKYGEGYTYGGLIPIGFTAGERQQQTLLSLDGGSLTISQRLEPEQGRGSISTLNMTFIDKDQYMTQVCSPGVLVPEILGQPVVIWLGYANTSFPDDYYPVWRGRVAQTNLKIGSCTMQFVDPGIVRRQQIFQMGENNLAQALGFTYALTLTAPATIAAGSVYSITVGSDTYEYTTWQDISAGEILGVTGPTNPPGTGTLTFVSGTGPTTVTYSSFTNYHFNLLSVPSSPISPGAVYSNSGQDFTVWQWQTGTNILDCSGTGAPASSSAVLTLVSGTGPATLNYSFATTNNPDTTIIVEDGITFGEKVVGPDGTYDEDVRMYLFIDSEFIEYQQFGQEAVGFDGYEGTSNTFYNVVRGARGTTPTTHDGPSDTEDGAEVDNYMQLTGQATDIALKLMLSGWQGPYLSNQSLLSFVQTGDPDTPNIANAIILPFSTDAIRDLGITVGDYITTSGASNAGNNGTWVVQGFNDVNGQTNRAILVNSTSFVSENPTSAVMAIRSQYDVWPDIAGIRMPGTEVDVTGWQYYGNTYLIGSENSYNFLISDNNTDAGKTFIENQILLPLGAYSLTRQGLASMGLTKPPLADQRTVLLNESNVIDPDSIQVARAINNRKYFNEIDWTFDYDDQGDATSLRDTIDAASLAQVGLSSVLPIDAQGARTDLGFLTVVEDRERFLFLRYAFAAILIDIKVNFGTGNQIEVGDVIILSDLGELQIPNLLTGVRNIGQQLFEVINRNLDIKTGETQLQLLGGLQANVTDRYATISGSSKLVVGSTASRIIISDSYGPLYPNQEYKKWQDYVGLNVVVHSPNYTTRNGSTTFTGFDPANNYAMLLSPALGFTPQPGDIVEIDNYPTNSSPEYEQLYKLVHCFQDPSVAVTSGVDEQNFNVGSGDLSKFAEGQIVLVHDASYTNLSPEVTITGISGTLITVSAALGFVPTAGMLTELIGFVYDGGGPYRLI